MSKLISPARVALKQVGCCSWTLPKFLLSKSPPIFTMNRCNYLTLTSRTPTTICNNSDTTKQTPLFSCCRIPKRHLFSVKALKIDKFEHIRAIRAKNHGAAKDRYIKRLEEFLETGNAESVVVSDLFNLIALAESDHHFDLIEKIVVIIKDSPGAEAKMYAPAIMRLYFIMGQIDRAYNVIKDVAKFGDIFDKIPSFQIAMTMLYNAGRYSDVVELHNLSKERVIDAGNMGRRRLSLIVFAAYAKMNTPEALEAAEKLYSEEPKNSFLGMRVDLFVSYLAVNNSKPTLALNLVSANSGRNHIALREVKTLALLNLKRCEDVLYHIRDSVDRIKRDQKVILNSTYDRITTAKDEIADEGVRHELTELLSELKENQLLSNEELENLVFREIPEPPDAMPQSRDFNRFNHEGGINLNQRQTNFGRRYDRPPRAEQRSNFGGNQRRYHNRDQMDERPKSYFESGVNEADLDDMDLETDMRFR